MPYVAKRFNQKRAPLRLVIDGDEINLEYYPLLFTDAVDEESKRWERDNMEEFRGHITAFFLRLVAWWDVVYEEGDTEPIELTLESLGAKPDLLYLEMMLINRIKEDINLGEVLRTASNGHSPVFSGVKRHRKR